MTLKKPDIRGLDEAEPGKESEVVSHFLPPPVPSPVSVEGYTADATRATTPTGCEAGSQGDFLKWFYIFLKLGKMVCPHKIIFC